MRGIDTHSKNPLFGSLNHVQCHNRNMSQHHNNYKKNIVVVTSWDMMASVP